MEKEIEKFCWFGGGGIWGEAGVAFVFIVSQTVRSSKRVFCYTNQKNGKQIIQLNILLFFSLLLKAGKEQCNTPDSPEGARVVAPRSPMSPQHIHPINTMIPAANNRSSSAHRHNSSSPTANGTPPPTVTPSSASALLANSTSAQDSQRLLKVRRFLGALVQFGQDTNADVGDRLRSLVLSLTVS
jgi:hypothetical protein